MAKTKYTKKVVQEILNWVAAGKPLKDLYNQDRSKYPDPTLVSKWAVRKGEFREAYHAAQWEGIYNKKEKLSYLLAHPPTIEGALDAEGKPDVRILGQKTTQWRQMISSLEKDINYFAAIYDKKFQKVDKQEVKQTGGPQILVVDYKNAEVDVPTHAQSDIFTTKTDGFKQ